MTDLINPKIVAAIREDSRRWRKPSAESHLAGKGMTVEAPKRPKYKLADLMTEMNGELPIVEGWDAMKPVGLEVAWWSQKTEFQAR